MWGKIKLRKSTKQSKKAQIDKGQKKSKGTNWGGPIYEK